VLATPRGIQLAPRDGAVTAIPIELGEPFALHGATVVFYREQQLWQSLRGATPTAIASGVVEPALIVHDRAQVVWIQNDPKGTRFMTVRGGKPHSITWVEGRVDTMVLSGDQVFFFEQAAEGRWRLGGVTVEDGAPVFRDWQSGRVPSTLAAARDLFYYDGPSRSVRRVSADLAQEDVLATGIICSPLAAKDRVTCARVGGLYELPLQGGAPKALSEQAPLISALATNGQEVAWLSDSGRDRLRVQRLVLPPPR